MDNDYCQMHYEDWRKTVTTAKEGARQRRAKKCVVYSVVVPVAHSSGSRIERELVSEVIHRVEEEGWALDKATAFASGGGNGYSAQESVLLIFRTTDR